MTFRDFVLLFAICLVWGLNIVIARWLFADLGVPPIFFAGVRFLGIALVLFAFLRPVPKDLRTLFLISMFIGAGHFALLFYGLAHAEASAAAVTGQLGVPFSTLMSMAFLGETIGWRRAMGIMLSFAGVVLIAFDPAGFSFSYGLLYIVASAFIGSMGGILMKRMAPISAFQMQAWVGLFSFAPLLALSAVVEGPGAFAGFVAADWPAWAALAFAVVGVSIFGHGGFYTLIKKYDVSMLSPLTLMTPIWGVVLSVVLLSEPLTANLVVGAAISLSGVFVIAIRRNRALPEAAIARKLGAGPS